MSIRSELTLSYLFLFLLVAAIGAAAFWSAERWRRAAFERHAGPQSLDVVGPNERDSAFGIRRFTYSNAGLLFMERFFTLQLN